MGALRNFFRFLPGAAGYGRSVMRQNKWIKAELDPWLEEKWSDHDGSLNDKLRNRMRQYALFTTTVCGEVYGVLHGSALSPTSRKLQTTLGALTPLYDDFFDHPDLSSDQVLAMMENPAGYQPQTSREGLFIELLQTLHADAPNRELFDNVFREVYRSQDASKRQTDPNLPPEELRHIVFDKGGQAALLFRSLVPHPLSKPEYETIWHWGALLQLLDDTFDIYEDHHEGIKTVANTATDLEAYQGEFHNLVAGLIHSIRDLELPTAQKEATINRMVFVLCWAFVALDQLVKLQNATGKPFEIDRFDRKQLICDMDKLGNQLRGMRLYCSFPI